MRAIRRPREATRGAAVQVVASIDDQTGAIRASRAAGDDGAGERDGAGTADDEAAGVAVQCVLRSIAIGCPPLIVVTPNGTSRAVILTVSFDSAGRNSGDVRLLDMAAGSVTRTATLLAKLPLGHQDFLGYGGAIFTFCVLTINL